MAKKKRYKDPYQEREASKYGRPIPSRELILEVITDHGSPVRFDELAALLSLEEETDKVALDRRLRAMNRDGQVLRNRRGGFLPVDEAQLVPGRVIGHPDGFGFLTPDEGGEDVFLTAREMRSLLHGDRALVRITGIDRRGRREGSVVEVLERRNESVVGRFFQEGSVGFVAPDSKRLNQDVLIPPENIGDARDGQIVIAAIVEQPTKRNQPIGRVMEVLGDHMAPGMEIDISMRSYGLPHEWPETVAAEAGEFPAEVPRSAAKGRVDLRNMPLVTIDGEDAKDFDDAVYCEPHGKGWRLLVAIADVSAYVNPGSALDEEARNRGTSIYFPGRVTPMLPEILSNGLCSLNPGVDRLCMLCEMEIGPHGKIGNYNFREAVMRSAARLTYDEVASIVVDRNVEARRNRAALVDHLDELYAVFRALFRQRKRRGAIDFETTETRIEFGPGKKIEQVVPMVRNDAHRLIEECMIAANVCAARYLLRHRMPALYRVHEGPREERIEALRSFLGEVALQLGGGETPEPKDYARLIDAIGDRPDAHLIQTVLLRSLSQAVYTSENNGHFGLSLKAYAHFTSPIRRYPDLLVHRAIRHRLRGGKPSEFHYGVGEMRALGEHCSMTERRADDATRDVVYWLKCEYMMDKVGEVFEGVISSVTSFGLFVELADVYVEGLVHLTALTEDYYHFDPAGHRLTGERGGAVYRLGDSMRVRVVRVNLDERKIDFEPESPLVEKKAEGRTRRGAGRRGKKRDGRRRK
ncbi:MAG: ribonuclease R [Pseudomonadota bacterium]|nr:ribonuclease R [Pseudomonadota bacterium]